MNAFNVCFKCKNNAFQRAIECIAWGRGPTGDSDTGDAETGDTKTSERERQTGDEVHFQSHVISLLPHLALVRSHHFDEQRAKNKLYKLMIKHFF